MRGDSNYAKRLGVALEAVRDYLDMTQDQVATAAGTSVSTISRYENGNSQADAHTILRIARALDVPLDLLMDPPKSRQRVFEAMAAWRGQRRSHGPEPS